MKYLDFIEKRHRMCNAMDGDCKKCPFRPHMGGTDVFYCYAFCVKLPSVAISLLQIWEKENPYLKECPFCGRNALFYSNDGVYGVMCSHSECASITAQWATKADAAEKWNERAAIE